MSNLASTSNAEQLLKFLLRLIGTFSLFALIFVFAPYAWMDQIHAQLGMGPLPSQPVVGYLARSTSAFYALLGGLFLMLSFDPKRHRAVLIHLSYSVIALGVILLFVDWLERMPLFWKLWEGPFVIIFGVVMLSLSRAIETKF
ncbi:hypothetical protein L0337_07090 [candidate division KSB1 bacterium]|nr:hypothetical protein [candidate division KSB1 bacterium]